MKNKEVGITWYYESEEGMFVEDFLKSVKLTDKDVLVLSSGKIIVVGGNFNPDSLNPYKCLLRRLKKVKKVIKAGRIGYKDLSKYQENSLGDKFTADENGVWHSYNGEPSLIMPKGTKYWHKHGKLHNENGPAYINTIGEKEYYLEDKKYSKEDWEMEVAKLKKKYKASSRFDRISNWRKWQQSYVK